MKVLIAILITIGLFAGCVEAIRLTHVHQITWIMILGTAAWAAIDSSRIGLQQYKSGISYGPVVLFVLIGGFWIVGFPWYLAIRFKIKADEATLKDVTEPVKSELAKEVPSVSDNEKDDDFDY